MKYLFFDLEFATTKGGIHKICEFGYILVDEMFNTLERDNIIINPKIERKEWDHWVVRKMLTRKIAEYESEFPFSYYYDRIKKLINGADYVVGHTVNVDVKAINEECQRYNMPSIDYVFYDTKNIYKDYSNTRQDTSVVNILKELGVDVEQTTHDAENDAYNTMLVFKIMQENLNVTFEKIIELSPDSKDRTENFVIESIEKKRIQRKIEFEKIINGDGTNDIKDHSIIRNIYNQFLDNVKPNKEGNDIFKNKKVSISINYEAEHFRQMLHLVQMIVNEGGTLVLKATDSDIFVKYEVILDDGTIKNDSRYNYVCEANQQGKNIEIIAFSELLSRLNITEEELDAMEPLSLKFLLEENPE